MIPLVICSPQPALRAGLRALLSDDPDVTLLAAAQDASAIGDLAVDVRVWVITPGGLGPSPELFLSHEQAVLVISENPAEARSLSRYELRAWGALSPQAPAEALSAAVHALAEGLIVTSPELFDRVDNMLDEPSFSSSQPPERLTPREIEVLRCLAHGQTNKQIAFSLEISEHTVKFHVSSIYAKLGAANRGEAVRLGAQYGWVPL
jgi:DNA-binding NarL/FixJ family response regulator